MNFAVCVNGLVFPFVKYTKAFEAMELTRGSLHRIVGKKSNTFVLSKKIGG